MIFLEVKNLQVSFSEITILKDVSFRLGKGEALGIFGPSGSGKTTAVRALIGLLPSASISGSVIYQGQNLALLGEKAMERIRGREIGYVFQHPSAAFLPTRKIGDQLVEILNYHRIDFRAKRNQIAKDLFSLVELNPDQDFQKLPHQLSGGEKQRAAIALALACNPKLLIVDEPTASLDHETKEQITQLFKTLQKKLQLSLIIISHDPEMLSELCDHLILLHEGKIILQGEPKKILSKYSPLAPAFSLPRLFVEKPLLEVKNLSLHLPTFSIKDISFSLKSKETLGLIGKSGAGKSTLAKAILQLISPPVFVSPVIIF